MHPDKIIRSTRARRRASRCANPDPTERLHRCLHITRIATSTLRRPATFDWLSCRLNLIIGIRHTSVIRDVSLQRGKHHETWSGGTTGGNQIRNTSSRYFQVFYYVLRGDASNDPPDRVNVFTMVVDPDGTATLGMAHYGCNKGTTRVRQEFYVCGAVYRLDAYIGSPEYAGLKTLLDHWQRASCAALGARLQ